MTKDEVKGLVTEGYRLSTEIAVLEEKLGCVKARLVTHANGNVIEVPGEGCKASVNYSTRMQSRLRDDQEPAVRKICGEFFEKLFCRAPIDKFRDVAKALLGEKAAKVVNLLEGAPAPRVVFRAA